MMGMLFPAARSLARFFFMINGDKDFYFFFIFSHVTRLTSFFVFFLKIYISHVTQLFFFVTIYNHPNTSDTDPNTEIIDKY